jgi:nucleoside-diphosphate-sugar epimerase
MKVLLTGSSGFLGRYLLQKLLQERCHVRILLHRHSISCKELDPAIEVLWGSIDDITTLQKAVRGIDCVVHAAWSFSTPFEVRPTMNEKASELLFRESVNVGVKKFAFISSIAVYGMSATCVDSIDESTAYAQGQELRFIYPAEKISIENSLKHFDKKNTMLAIFRPGPIFDETKAPIFKILSLGKIKLGIGLGNGKNHMAYIHAQDVADAVWRWLLNGTDGEVYNIVPSICMNSSDWHRAWAKASNSNLRMIFIPPEIFRMMFMGRKMLLKCLGKPNKHNVSYTIMCATRDMAYNNSFLTQNLHWRDEATSVFSSSLERTSKV